MKRMRMFAVSVFFGCVSLFLVIFLHAESVFTPPSQKGLLVKTMNPLLFSLSESLYNRYLAEDEDLGKLDVSSHPRTQTIDRFLDNYMDGRVSLGLVSEDSAEVLRAYLNDLRKHNLRYTSFRIGAEALQRGDVYQVNVKLIGFGKKIPASVSIMRQTEGNWKILSFSADYPH